MASPLDVTVRRFITAPPEAVRRVMFDPEQDPAWMAAVTSVARLSGGDEPGGRVRRTGRFMGRTLRWTTEVLSASAEALDLRIIDGPMRGTVSSALHRPARDPKSRFATPGPRPVSRRGG